MARSLLQAFVSGTRQLLSVQLIIAVGAVALAGWTLAVTNTVIRDRNQLQARVVQLETELTSRGVMVPAPPVTVDQTGPAQIAANAYPPQIGLATRAAGAVTAVQQQDAAAKASAAPDRGFNPARIIGEIFAPTPPLRLLVLHVRAPGDSEAASEIARNLAGASLHITVDLMQPRDQRQSGYSYFDGRQSRAAAALVSKFNDGARRNDIATWSAQLSGVALPAQGEFSVDRLDIVLPSLPAPATSPAPSAAAPG